MKKIVTSLDSFRPYLESNRSMSTLGSHLLPLRSETLMRDHTFSNQPVDCLLFSLTHLEKGESDIADVLSWLNQVHLAYQNITNKTIWHHLAEAIRLDIMVQLNDLRLDHAIKTRNEVKAAQINNNNSMEDTYKVITGLIGFYLGYRVENNDYAINAYDDILTQLTDPALIEIIKTRKISLNHPNYIPPQLMISLDDKADFKDAKNNIIYRYIDDCLSEGYIPMRPEYHSEITNNIVQGAALTVFAPPIALVAIPAALIAAPFTLIADHVNYRNDQNENALYYATLDEANKWKQEYIKKRAHEAFPELIMTRELTQKLCSELKPKMELLAKHDYNRQYQSLKQTIDYNRSNLNDMQRAELLANLSPIKNKINELDKLISSMDEILDLIKAVLSYLNSNNEISNMVDGKISAHVYGLEKMSGTKLSEVTQILPKKKDEFLGLESNAISQSTDLHQSLLLIKKTSEDYISKTKQQRQQQLDQSEKLERQTKKMF